MNLLHLVGEVRRFLRAGQVEGAVVAALQAGRVAERLSVRPLEQQAAHGAKAAAAGRPTKDIHRALER